MLLVILIVALKHTTLFINLSPMSLLQSVFIRDIMVSLGRGQGEGEGHEGENDGQSFHGVAPGGEVDDGGEHSTEKPPLRHAEMVVAGTGTV